MSRARGVAAQNWLARYLTVNGWPHAESVGSGRPGTDVKGTPGIAWENKTARAFEPAAWVRQARKHASDGLLLPVAVYWPKGVGEKSPEAAMAILALPELVALLHAAGYGEPAACKVYAACAVPGCTVEIRDMNGEA
jgi:hypothetical protein